MSLSTWFRAFLDLLFPDQCVGCGARGALFCTHCHTSLRPYPHDEAPPVGLDAVAIAWRYEGALRRAIHRMKYSKTQRIATPLGQMIAVAVQHQLPPADAIMPVPLHRDRLAERGFNQAEALARPLAAQLRLPLICTGLVRVRDTGHQAGLSRADRRTNIAGAFHWVGQVPPPRRVILVDDVLTTGATLVACATALRTAGSVHVAAAALGRSIAPDQR